MNRNLRGYRFVAAALLMAMMWSVSACAQTMERRWEKIELEAIPYNAETIKQYPFLPQLVTEKDIEAYSMPTISVGRISDKSLGKPLLLVRIFGPGFCGVRNCPLEIYAIEDDKTYKHIDWAVVSGPETYIASCPSEFFLGLTGGGKKAIGLWKYENEKFMYVDGYEKSSVLPPCGEKMEKEKE